MKPEDEASRWQEIGELFDQLADLEPLQREARLQRLATEDVELFEEIESLLRAESEAPRWLDEPAGERFEPLLDETEEAAEEVPARIASYRVLEKIGHGGMGVVYLAEREGVPGEQRVAVKVVKGGVDTDEVIGRFRRERRILARLEHPAIARLLDAGATADGRPYFAMELVEGEPITLYCESRRLSVEERLRLFGTVCDAVQHAHRALVVHRDLKPANILVTADGQPKLLDFGIGKLLAGAAGAADNIIQTAVGRRLMTPEYAAPEQFAGGPASTSMDVYALGVVLCELLVGRRPTGRRRATPTRPSALVATDGTEEVARARGLSLQALERRLAGDLDTIVVTALRGDPKRRYPSVQALADDIELHVNGQPVAAGTAGEAPASSGAGDWGSPRSSSSP